MTSQSRIETLYLSQEDLLRAGCLDMGMAMEAAEQAMLAFRNDEILFPEKIVQIFNQETQERINCLPATLLSEKICGVKWVSVFPENPEHHGVQNLSAVIILSEIEKGFPVALLEGTLCSNMRVGAMGGVAARHFARQDSRSIAFIGAASRPDAPVAMKKAVPALEECRVASKFEHEEKQFVAEMAPLFPTSVSLPRARTCNGRWRAPTFSSPPPVRRRPLLRAAWMKPGAFYSHIGGWEDEYEVARRCPEDRPATTGRP